MQLIHTDCITCQISLPKKPDEIAVKVMQEMFEASVDNQPYDAERWSQLLPSKREWQARTGDPQMLQVLTPTSNFK